MNFADRLSESCSKNKSFLLVGIDPQVEIIPTFLVEKYRAKNLSQADFIEAVLKEFCTLSVEAVKQTACAIKPNSAFFEAFGIAGLKALEELCLLCKQNDLPFILDAKRGDIANTALAYARSAFDLDFQFAGEKVQTLDADAVTVNPFLGLDTLDPFLEACRSENKGLFVLCRTSNPGSGYFQGIKIGTESISEILANDLAKIAEEHLGSCGLSAIGAVVGATYPEEAIKLRKLMPKNIFLIPGLGTQGADFQTAVQGFASNKQGAIVNSSRALFQEAKKSTSEEEFKSKVKEASEFFRNGLNQALGTL